MLTMVTAASNAQTYPTRTVRLIVGFAAGGGTDVVARLLAQKLAETLGQPFVVENKPGATGTIGAKAVATSPADGYTLLMAHVNSQAIAPALSETPPYDPDHDFAPVAYIGFVPNVLVVNPALPVKTLAELVRSGENPAQRRVLRLAGGRKHEPSCRRDAAHRNRRQVRPRALQRQRAGHDRPAGRTGRPELRRHVVRDAVHPEPGTCGLWP